MALSLSLSMPLLSCDGRSPLDVVCCCTVSILLVCSQGVVIAIATAVAIAIAIAIVAVVDTSSTIATVFAVVISIR